MTICIAIKCVADGVDKKETILFSTDTQVSSSYITSSITKCRQISSKEREDDGERWNILFAASGNAYLIDEVFYRFERYLRKVIEKSLFLVKGW